MGKQETLETIWEVPDELWERIEPIILEEDRRPKPGAASALPHDRCSRRHHLPAAQRVPMEPIAERAWGRQHHSSHLSTVGRAIRRRSWHRMWGALVEGCWRGLGMARRQTDSHGQGTFWGDLDWAQPYGPWQGWYQAQSPCGWRGRPLEHCGCGSKRARCQAVGGDPGRRRTTTAHRGGTPTPVSGQRV